MTPLAHYVRTARGEYAHTTTTFFIFLQFALYVIVKHTKYLCIRRRKKNVQIYVPVTALLQSLKKMSAEFSRTAYNAKVQK